MKKFFSSFFCVLCLIFFSACGKHDSSKALSEAETLADSLANSLADGCVVKVDPNLIASFTIADSDIDITDIGADLFDVFAAQELKSLSARDINMVCNALKQSGGEFTVVLNSVDGQSAEFTLSPQKIINLHKASLLNLNTGAAKEQIVSIARKMVPAPEAHAGAVRVETSISKTFLEYDIIWSSVTSYHNFNQGVLTRRYFNPLKEQYQALGALSEPITIMLKSLGIDGVRIVYSAEDSDRQLRQAFPWRELSEPVTQQ